MSTWRNLVVPAVVCACSSSGVSKPPAAPPPAAAPTERHAAAEPGADPVCAELAAAKPDDSADEAPSSAGDDTATDEPEDGSRRRRKQQKITACSVTTTNIAREAGAILAANPRSAQAPRAAWDHRSAPERLDLIRRRFDLDRPELDVLHRTGVVVPARLELPSYAYGYHEIFQS